MNVNNIVQLYLYVSLYLYNKYIFIHSKFRNQILSCTTTPTPAAPATTAATTSSTTSITATTHPRPTVGYHTFRGFNNTKLMQGLLSVCPCHLNIARHSRAKQFAKEKRTSLYYCIWRHPKRCKFHGNFWFAHLHGGKICWFSSFVGGVKPAEDC